MQHFSPNFNKKSLPNINTVSQGKKKNTPSIRLCYNKSYYRSRVLTKICFSLKLMLQKILNKYS